MVSKYAPANGFTLWQSQCIGSRPFNLGGPHTAFGPVLHGFLGLIQALAHGDPGFVGADGDDAEIAEHGTPFGDDDLFGAADEAEGRGYG